MSATIGAALLVVGLALPALAVHDETFQLDGNTTVDAPGAPPFDSAIYDWESLFNDNALGSVGGAGSPDVTLVGDFIDADFVEDWGLTETGTFSTSDPSTFKSAKDNEDIDAWNCDDANQVTDKGDITNAYAALYDDGGDRILYFGMEKTTDNGDNNVGLWVLQDGSVACDPNGTLEPGSGEPFQGNHVDGDLFIVSEFTNGGGVSSVNVYEWTAGTLSLVASGVDCAITGANDNVCATTNRVAIDPQWDHVSKPNGVNANLEPASTLEGGINLDAFPEFAEGCFTGFLFNTRSSQELTATLYDYAQGDIDTCHPEVSLDKEPEDQTHNVGDTFDWTIEVENTGDGPADDAVVTDTIPDGLTINSAVVVPGTAGSCDVTGQEVECTVDLDVGESATITVNVTSTLDVFGESEDGCIDIDNTATVTVDGDTNVEDDSDTVAATICRPLVEKTAAGSYTHDVQWEIEKSVDIDQHTQNAGEDADSTYTVTVTKTVQDSGFSVTGNITITNPNLEDAMTVDVTDALSSGESLAATAIDCPGTEDGDDLVVAANSSVVCTYTIAPADADSGTNTATVTLNSIEFTDDAAYVFTPTNTGEPEEISVTDTFDGTPSDLGTVSDTTTFDDYTHNFACSTDEGLYTDGHYEYSKTNTVEINETIGDSDTETVDVDCYIPTITKTAEGDYRHGVDWTIEKDVDIDQHTMLAGEDADSTYTVTVTKEVTDTDFAVTGSITVANPNPDDDMTVDVTDLLSSGEAAAAGDIDCGAAGDGDDLVVPNGESVVCTYELNPLDADPGTNTATATFSADADVSVSDDAAYTFTATNEGEPETVNVQDDFDGTVTALGTVSVTTTFTDYDHNFACPTDETLYEDGHYEFSKDNTASIIETDDEDSETVNVDCYIPTITKSADGSFDRDWDWTIEKEGDQTNLTLSLDQHFLVNYTVTVDPTATDSEFEVTGSITVGNPSPEDDMTVDVTDALSSGESLAAGDIDCGAAGDGDDLLVAAGESVECTYDFSDIAGVTAGDDGTNTATAAFSSDADVSVSDTDGYAFDLDAETDECIDVSDTLGGDFGTICADDDPATFTIEYTYDIVADECGETEVPNTASFETSDQDGEGDDTGSDDWNVIVNVECEQGCSLTQGYWKTHSAYGPAPTDEAWMDLPDVDGDGVVEGPDETFFLSGKTWYEVFWTKPAGNAYYNLAKQYMAAVLNGVNGASTTVVDDEIADAEALFEVYTPADIAPLKGKKQPRPQFISLAGTLASYNEGDIGPGHCDEDSRSSQEA